MRQKPPSGSHRKGGGGGGEGPAHNKRRGLCGQSSRRCADCRQSLDQPMLMRLVAAACAGAMGWSFVVGFVVQSKPIKASGQLEETVTEGAKYDKFCSFSPSTSASRYLYAFADA